MSQSAPNDPALTRFPPVPDEYIYDGFRKMTLGAPKGMEDRVRPLELSRDDEAHEFWILVDLNEDDIKRGKVWIILHSDAFPPISSATAYKKGELTDD